MANEYVSAIFGLVGVVVGGALTIGYGAFKEWRIACKDRGYLAIHVVGALEEYIDKALSVYWDNDGEDDGSKHDDAPYPEFKPKELTGEWKSIPAALAYRIFNLQTKTAYAIREIRSAAEQGVYSDHDEFYQDRKRKFGDLTEEAISISDELRALATLPAREARSTVCDSVTMFKRDLERAKQVLAKTRQVSG